MPKINNKYERSSYCFYYPLLVLSFIKRLSSHSLFQLLLLLTEAFQKLADGGIPWS